MFGSDILETAIGLSLIYLVLSSVCSAGRELLEAIVKTRAVGLERGIAELLHDPAGTGLTRALYEHPLINGLFFGTYAPRLPRPKWLSWLPRGGDQLPSYIPSRAFSAALFDLLVRGSGRNGAAAPVPDDAPITIESLRAAALSIQNEPVRRVFVTAIDRAGNDIDAVRKQVEDWFDAGMDRVSGWYRRQTQYVLFILAVLVTVAANADSLVLIRHLSSSTATRQALIEQAGHVTLASQPMNAASVKDEIDALQPLQLPLGWNGGIPQGGWPQRILGWLLTALAVSLGAPFWFDMLGKFMSVRSTLKVKDTSPAPPPDKPLAPPVVVMASAPVATTPPAPSPPAYAPHRWSNGDPDAGVL